MGKLIDLTGQRFGRLTVVSLAEPDKASRRRWHCVCDCGKTIDVSTGNLRSGNTKSCGCLVAEMSDTLIKRHPRIYNSWKAMISRCKYPSHPAYKNYGGRGITIYPEWMKFEIFLNWALKNGYRDGLTIDRIDNDQGYSPKNCRWITSKAQNYNRRSNHLLKYNGQTRTIAEWAALVSMKPGTLVLRLRRGWSVEKALETPINGTKKIILLEYKGERRTIQEWAARAGMKEVTLRARLNRGWAIERALETPVTSKKKL